jgi:hypothetical protein
MDHGARSKKAGGRFPLAPGDLASKREFADTEDAGGLAVAQPARNRTVTMVIDCRMAL